jgi:hypothetical protein
MQRSPVDHFLFSLTRAQSAGLRASTVRANKQKGKLYTAVAATNFDAVTVLHHISSCATPFAGLLRCVVEEFRFTSLPLHSQEVEDIKRDSAVDCGRREVELQRLMQRVERMKADGAGLRAQGDARPAAAVAAPRRAQRGHGPPRAARALRRGGCESARRALQRDPRRPARSGTAAAGRGRV